MLLGFARLHELSQLLSYNLGGFKLPALDFLQPLRLCPTYSDTLRIRQPINLCADPAGKGGRCISTLTFSGSIIVNDMGDLFTQTAGYRQKLARCS
jgi:hypothetical protein